MDIKKVIEVLKHKDYTVSYFENAKEAAKYLNNTIDNKSVGFGDSATLLNMGLFESLSSHNEVFDPQHCAIGVNFIDTAKKCLTQKSILRQ